MGAYTIMCIKCGAVPGKPSLCICQPYGDGAHTFQKVEGPYMCIRCGALPGGDGSQCPAQPYQQGEHTWRKA